MTAEANAVQDRLGETTDHAMHPGPEPGTPPAGGQPARAAASPGEGRASPHLSPGEGRGTPFLFATGDQPLAGYTIKRGVGSGGFGEVYYAVSDAGKDVALKLIRRNLETELRGMRQCLNLKHPNLLTLFDIRTDDSGDTWIVMEYIAGKSLEAELADHPKGLPVGQALTWFRGIASGVAYLHDHGIVHRDLKPGNIFCDEGVVKVGDYGLSKFISCSRRSGHTESIGTVHYMAPEVAHGRYGKELDIYALGAILFELLTGRVPFDGESVGEVLMKHLTAPPDVSQLAEPFRSVVTRALEKDPARRFSTVGEMLAAVGTAGLGRSVGADSAAGAIPFAIPVAQPVPPHARHAGDPGASRYGYQPPYESGAAGIDDTEGEPIARAVRRAIADMRRDWQSSKLRSMIEKHYYLKVALVVSICVGLLCFSYILIPTAVFLLVVYGIYRVVRGCFLFLFPPRRSRPSLRRTQRMPSQAAPSQAAAAPPIAVLAVKPPLERLRELIGSLLVATMVTAATCVVMVLIASQFNRSEVPPGQCAWLFFVSLAGTWIVLIAGKLWEGSEGEAMLRRFILMTLGLGLGLAASAAAEIYYVHLPPDPGLSTGPPYTMFDKFYPDGRPQVMAHMAAFAALLALVRWWRQCDPLRGSRLSLGSLFVTVIAAHIVAMMLQYPEPWLMMVAGCMSVAVQLAGPWVPAYARLKPQKKKVI